MKTVALTFTFPPDAVRASTHLTLLPQHWIKVWVVESKHKDMPVPYGVQKRILDFPRGATLRDNEAIKGLRSTYINVQKEFDADCVVKLDSDCALLRPEAWTAPIEYSGVDFVYIRRYAEEANRMHANGCCYAMSRRAIDRLTQHFYPMGFPPDIRGHEDLAFSRYFNDANPDLVHCQLDKSKVCWYSMPYWGTDTLCAHLGYDTLEVSNEKVNKLLAIKNRPPLPSQHGYAQAIAEYIRKNPSFGVVPERRAV